MAPARALWKDRKISTPHYNKYHNEAHKILTRGFSDETTFAALTELLRLQREINSTLHAYCLPNANPTRHKSQPSKPPHNRTGRLLTGRGFITWTDTESRADQRRHRRYRRKRWHLARGGPKTTQRLLWFTGDTASPTILLNRKRNAASVVEEESRQKQFTQRMLPVP